MRLYWKALTLLLWSTSVTGTSPDYNLRPYERSLRTGPRADSIHSAVEKPYLAYDSQIESGTVLERGRPLTEDEEATRQSAKPKERILKHKGNKSKGESSSSESKNYGTSKEKAKEEGSYSPSASSKYAKSPAFGKDRGSIFSKGKASSGKWKSKGKSKDHKTGKRLTGANTLPTVLLSGSPSSALGTPIPSSLIVDAPTQLPKLSKGKGSSKQSKSKKGNKESKNIQTRPPVDSSFPTTSFTPSLSFVPTRPSKGGKGKGKGGSKLSKAKSRQGGKGKGKGQESESSVPSSSLEPTMSFAPSRVQGTMPPTTVPQPTLSPVALPTNSPIDGTLQPSPTAPTEMPTVPMVTSSTVNPTSSSIPSGPILEPTVINSLLPTRVGSFAPSTSVGSSEPSAGVSTLPSPSGGATSFPTQSIPSNEPSIGDGDTSLPASSNQPSLGDTSFPTPPAVSNQPSLGATSFPTSSAVSNQPSLGDTSFPTLPAFSNQPSVGDTSFPTLPTGVTSSVPTATISSVPSTSSFPSTQMEEASLVPSMSPSVPPGTVAPSGAASSLPTSLSAVPSTSGLPSIEREETSSSPTIPPTLPPGTEVPTGMVSALPTAMISSVPSTSESPSIQMELSSLAPSVFPSLQPGSAVPTRVASDLPTVTSSAAPSTSESPSFQIELPSLVPSMFPSLPPVTDEPTGSVAPVAVTPFLVDYNIASGQPSEQDFADAAAMTIAYLDEYMRSTFDLESRTDFSSLEGALTGTSLDPLQIGFEADAWFDSESEFFPSQEELDLLTSIAFTQPSVQTLLIMLRNLPPENPFSTVLDVQYQEGMLGTAAPMVSLAPVMEPTAAPGTNMPTQAIISISATPFAVAYSITGGEPSEQAFDQAASTTIEYLNEYMAATFGLGSEVLFDSFAGRVLGTETGDPIEITFEGEALFGSQSEFITSEEELDLILSIAFTQPSVQTLLIMLRNLPTDNAFSSASDVSSSQVGAAPTVLSSIQLAAMVCTFFAIMAAFGAVMLHRRIRDPLKKFRPAGSDFQPLFHLPFEASSESISSKESTRGSHSSPSLTVSSRASKKGHESMITGISSTGHTGADFIDQSSDEDIEDFLMKEVRIGFDPLLSPVKPGIKNHEILLL